MSDHADIVRDTLSWIHTHPDLSMEFQRDAEKHLDALVADEKEARERWNRSEIHAAGLMTQMSLLVAERDEAREAFRIAMKEREEAAVRVTELEAALGAVKAWLDQEEEVGLGVPDILWDIILAAAPTKEGTE